MDVLVTCPQLSRLEPSQIEARVRGCARLPSLGSINSALRELLTADQRYSSQISEIIRRDPSLTSRLLRLVNSVYFGLTTPVNSIEEAVFYLGIRQIRQLAMVTPVIEDFQRLAGQCPFPWREFWQHCIGAAIMTREVISTVNVPQDEADYVAGLVHDVGKIVMASAFSAHFTEIHRRLPDGLQDLMASERDILGMDHAEVGALYLRHHALPEVMAEAAQFHHEPHRAGQHAPIVAAVHLANLLVHCARIGHSGNTTEVTTEMWTNSSAWTILFPQQSEAEKAIARASLKRSLERLPTILEGLV